MEQKIKSIEKGSGQDATYFQVNDEYKYAICGNKISEIVEAEKEIEWAGGQSIREIKIYSGYDSDKKKLFEIEASSSLTIIYE